MIETLPLHHFARVASLLGRGEIVAFPTGTSYGLGVNALDVSALERLRVLKSRAADKPFTVLLPNRNPDRFVSWTPLEEATFSAFCYRPLTLLVKATRALQHLATEGRVGVRTPDHPFTRSLMDITPFPVTATSANIADQPAACSPMEVEAIAGSGRLYVVEGGTLPRCAPSTIAVRMGNAWRIVRNGEVSLNDLTEALG